MHTKQSSFYYCMVKNTKDSSIFMCKKIYQSGITYKKCSLSKSCLVLEGLNHVSYLPSTFQNYMWSFAHATQSCMGCPKNLR